ncbi:60 kDa SS-A/Ro ribonucleoprotein-like isoform X2 [Thrips palmi]|nr:60 kDa SS-A/Ro ribonucleoprotein-like isoform X2 [Thrips palmi]XP_034233931.1 60 kDa SS-A/Ro ribonucleoprotein-like isoform X2 [Thrips palmi]XP_034233932.1 60 kDa SS-A/Ro ribonucleoprotein-like isoform X2 [Thrips palmi]
MSDTPKAQPPAEVRLKRFLHYGSESAVCVPGDREFLKCFLMENLPSIEEMLADCPPEKQGDAVNHIMKAFMDGYSGYPECLIFALAVCACQKTSERLRSQAYNALKTVCKTPKDIFLFVSFTKKLSAPHKGHGNGWRNALTQWYLSKEPMDMAASVSLFRGFYGFTHKDLFRLCHIKAEDKVKGAIVQYVMKGLEASKMTFDKEDDPTIQQVFSYLQIVEEIKHQTDVQASARLIELHNLPIVVVPAHNVKSPEVWIAAVPNMPLGELLDNLVRLSCAGLLKSGPLEQKIVDRLLDQTAIVESHLHPTQVYCAMKRYECHAKNTHEFMEKLIKMKKVEKELKPAPKPSTKILDALNHLLNSTLKLLVPTGKRYLVAIDLSHNMKSWHCNGARDVAPAMAATLLALSLLHAEREVTVVAFPALPGAPPEKELIDPVNPVVQAFIPVEQAVNRRAKKQRTAGPIHPRKTSLEPMVPLTLEKDVSIADNLAKMMSESLHGPVEVCQPMVWAQQSKKPIDVFIVLTDYVTPRKRAFKDPAIALQEYRQQMNLPQTKLITCALASNELNVAAANDAGMLDIVGFNGKVARIIEAFSRGAF